MQIIKNIFVVFLLIFATNIGWCDSVTDSVHRFDLAAMKKYIESASYTIQFKEVCAAMSSSSNICVTDAFSKTNVQMIQATALATEYINLKYGKQSTCSPSYRSKGNDDYIKCTTTDKSMFFEFEFDDVAESFDDTIKNSVFEALCKMHGGKFNSRCFTTSTVCNSIDKSMQKFGYNASWRNIMNQQPYCNPIFNTVYSADSLRTAFNVDNLRFSALQLQSMNDLIFLLKRYTQREMAKQNIDLYSFNCTSSFKTLKTGNLTNPKDDILTCTANGKPIDFVFDDLNESWSTTYTGSTAGLECIADQGGNFDGRRCLGLSQSQCSEANTKVAGGTKWDPVLETCVLAASDKAANLDRGIQLASGVGLTVGIATVAILSGGTTVVVLVGVGASVAGSVTSEVITSVETNKTADFLIESSKCKQEQCAKNALKQLLGEIRDYSGDVPQNMQKALDDEAARLIELINDEAFYEQLIAKNAVAKDKNALVITKKVADIVTIIGDLVSLYPGFLKSISKLKNIQVLTKTNNAILTKITKNQKLISRVSDIATINDHATFGRVFTGD